MTNPIRQTDSAPEPQGADEPETERQQMCGTFVLRQGLEKMTEEERQKFFDEMEKLGMAPVI